MSKMRRFIAVICSIFDVLRPSDVSDFYAGEDPDLKLLYFIPIQAFPHLLIFYLGYQTTLSVYFGISTFFGITIICLGIVLVGALVERKLVVRIAFWASIGSFLVFLTLAFIMAFGEYNSVKASRRPAPNTTTCLFLCFLNLLSIWSFSVSAEYLSPAVVDPNEPNSYYAVKYEIKE
ncbi:unnamed protein product [Caenorhabditis brenneri]